MLIFSVSFYHIYSITIVLFIATVSYFSYIFLLSYFEIIFSHLYQCKQCAKFCKNVSFLTYMLNKIDFCQFYYNFGRCHMIFVMQYVRFSHKLTYWQNSIYCHVYALYCPLVDSRLQNKSSSIFQGKTMILLNATGNTGKDVCKPRFLR